MIELACFIVAAVICFYAGIVVFGIALSILALIWVIMTGKWHEFKRGL